VTKNHEPGLRRSQELAIPTSVDLSGHNLIAAILHEHNEVLAAEARGLPHAIACGELLRQKKQEVKQQRSGRWIQWLGANLPSIPRRTASEYMLLAENVSLYTVSDENGQHAAQISARRALEIIKAQPSGKRKSNPKKTHNNQSKKFDIYDYLKNSGPDELALAVNQTWGEELRHRLIRHLCGAGVPLLQIETDFDHPTTEPPNTTGGKSHV
jgi:hypothetical protein